MDPLGTSHRTFPGTLVNASVGPSVAGSNGDRWASRPSRRQWISALGGGFGACVLADLLAGPSPARADEPPRRPESSTAGSRTNETRTAGPSAGRPGVVSRPPRAKRVIFLFMAGGPSHLDLFDEKPLLAKYAGQRPPSVDLRTERVTGGLLPSPWKFAPGGQSGLRISELLPRIRDCADDLCVVKSVVGGNPNHAPAANHLFSGRIDQIHPSLGAWVSYGLGTENSDLPAFVSLSSGATAVRYVRSGYLPSEHQGTPIDMAEKDPAKMVQFLRNQHWGTETQRRQFAFLQRMNRRQAEAAVDPVLDSRLRALETAYRMQFAAGDVFALEQETRTVREEYGETPMGNGCLVARRLVERGVRFIHLELGGWDHHENIDKAIAGSSRQIDQPIAALLGDLKRRGLLEETLVVWGGEFGRTPVSESGNGRDHNHYGFTMWLAGGGVRGGMSYGATDDFGFRAVDRRVSVHDLHATLLHLMGVDHERLTYHHSGRDFRLTDVHGTIVHDWLA